MLNRKLSFTGGMMTADELRSLAKRLSDWPWQTIRGYCSRTGWILALEQDCQISAAALSAQADLLDELSKQEPVEEKDAEIARLNKALKIAEAKNKGSLANNLCPDHRDKQMGKPCLACLMEKAERERDLWKLKWKQLNDDLAEALDELDSLRNKTRPKR